MLSFGKWPALLYLFQRVQKGLEPGWQLRVGFKGLAKKGTPNKDETSCKAEVAKTGLIRR